MEIASYVHSLCGTYDKASSALNFGCLNMLKFWFLSPQKICLHTQAVIQHLFSTWHMSTKFSSMLHIACHGLPRLFLVGTYDFSISSPFFSHNQLLFLVSGIERIFMAPWWCAYSLFLFRKYRSPIETLSKVCLFLSLHIESPNGAQQIMSA